MSTRTPAAGDGDVAELLSRDTGGLIEVPVHFEDRDSGRSKLTPAVQWEAARLPWRLRRRSSRLPTQQTERDTALV